MNMPHFLQDFVDRWTGDNLPPIFCLTLAEEPWKEAAAREHFETRAIHHVAFVHGFHGMLLGLRPSNPFQFNQDGTPEYIHIAQAGCVLSHILALKMALATKLPEFIICEDDIQLCEDFKDRWQELRAQFPSRISIVQLDYVSVAGPDGLPYPSTEVSPGLIRRPHYAHCASMIWWRREAAEQAEYLLRPIDAPFDIMLMRKVYPFFEHALADPPLAAQRTAYGSWPSSIGIQAGKPQCSNS